MLLDLPTTQQVDALAAKLDQVLALLGTAAATPRADELLTLDQVAAYTQFDRRTVRKWVTHGLYGHDERRVYLPALVYGDLLRFKRGDVEAFGLKVGVLAPVVAGQAPQPTKKAAKPRKRAPLPSEAALKVA